MKFHFLFTWLLAAGFAGAQTTYVTSDFRGKTAPDWSFVTGQGTGPVLTAAAGADEDGDGWLRLTQDTLNQSSFVYNNLSLATAYGLQFTFDFVIWGARTTRADGLTLAIFDADVTASAGAYGGSLGYAQRTGIDGLAGGIVGFGFDTFGNFSRASEGRIGGPGQEPNSIAIRGSAGATRAEGYEYVTGVNDLESFSSQATSRAEAVVHSVRITIPTDKKISVEWKAEGEDWVTLIDEYQCDITCPDEVKFGFTAGTGSVSSNQEIRNLTVTSVTPIPEPAGIFLISAALAAVFWTRRRP